MNFNALEIYNVRPNYIQDRLYSAFTFNVLIGTIFGIYGPPKTAKTTLIKIVSGVIAPGAGKVKIFGKSPMNKHNPVIKGIGFMPQTHGLYKDLTVREIFTYFSDNYKIDGTELQKRLDGLKEFGIDNSEHDQLVAKLLAGKQRLLSLSVCLIHSPKLVFLDEPTDNLDDFSKHLIWSSLMKLNQDQGTTIILTTKSSEEIRICSSHLELFDNRYELHLDNSIEFSKSFNVGNEILDLGDSSDNQNDVENEMTTFSVERVRIQLMKNLRRLKNNLFIFYFLITFPIFLVIKTVFEIVPGLIAPQDIPYLVVGMLSIHSYLRGLVVITASWIQELSTGNRLAHTGLNHLEIMMGLVLAIIPYFFIQYLFQIFFTSFWIEYQSFSTICLVLLTQFGTSLLGLSFALMIINLVSNEFIFRRVTAFFFVLPFVSIAFNTYYLRIGESLILSTIVSYTPYRSMVNTMQAIVLNDSSIETAFNNFSICFLYILLLNSINLKNVL